MIDSIDYTPNGSLIRERSSGLLFTFLCQEGRFFWYRERFGRQQMHKERDRYASRFSVVQGEKGMKDVAKDCKSQKRNGTQKEGQLLQ